MRFFIDNNLGKKLADGMRAFGENVIHLKDEFDEETDDEEWLKAIGRKGYFVISRDLRIRKRPAERKAFSANKVGAFFLGGKNRSSCDLIIQLVRNWPRIEELARKTKRPFAFRVPPKGTKITAFPL